APPENVKDKIKTTCSRDDRRDEGNLQGVEELETQATTGRENVSRGQGKAPGRELSQIVIGLIVHLRPYQTRKTLSIHIQAGKSGEITKNADYPKRTGTEGMNNKKR
ncbi:hypothetical protein, partial [Salmonella enterica]|uniref:hypothetical protein n=1 Tax=Salmonella enterica TaxID=28901 RepID=UPI00398C64C4